MCVSIPLATNTCVAYGDPTPLCGHACLPSLASTHLPAYIITTTPTHVLNCTGLNPSIPVHVQKGVTPTYLCAYISITWTLPPANMYTLLYTHCQLYTRNETIKACDIENRILHNVNTLRIALDLPRHHTQFADLENEKCKFLAYALYNILLYLTC